MSRTRDALVQKDELVNSQSLVGQEKKEQTQDRYPRTYRVNAGTRHFLNGLGILLVLFFALMTPLHILGVMKHPLGPLDLTNGLARRIWRSMDGHAGEPVGDSLRGRYRSSGLVLETHAETGRNSWPTNGKNTQESRCQFLLHHLARRQG
jgi:hypothetical protein